MENYINTAASDIARARTVGLTQLTPEPFQVLVVGTRTTQAFIFANRGTLETWSGATDRTLRLTVGNSVSPPQGATFALTVGSGDPLTIPFDADAAGLKNALNDDATIDGDGGVDVVTQGLGRFLIAYKEVGTVSAIVASAALTYPDCSASVAVLTTGDSTTRQLVMLTISRSIAAQSTAFDAISTPYAGFSCILDLNTAAAKEFMRINGELRGAYLECTTLLTLEVFDASGNPTCYYQSSVQLRALNYDNAVTLMETGPTRNAQANSSGDVTVTPLSQIHTERITVTGASGTRNIVVLSPSGIVAGARIDLVFILSGATNGTRLKIYALSTSGTLLFDFTRDGDEANAEFILYANGAGGFDRKEQTIPAFPNI